MIEIAVEATGRATDLQAGSQSLQPTTEADAIGQHAVGQSLLKINEAARDGGGDRTHNLLKYGSLMNSVVRQSQRLPISKQRWPVTGAPNRISVCPAYVIPVSS